MVATRKKPAQSKSKSLVKFDRSKLASLASNTKKMAFEEANFIKCDAMGFVYEGKRFRDPMDVIILDAVFEKAYFDRPYVEGEGSAPACAAISHDDDNLIPFPKSPFIQASNCTDCPLNKFETAAIGKGKACGDKVKIAMVPADFLKNPQVKPKIAYMRIPATSIKNYRGYLKEIGQFFNAKYEHWTSFCAVTTISSGPHEDKSTGYKVEFAMGREIENDVALDALFNLCESIQEDIVAAPDFSQYKPLPAKTKAKAKAKAVPKKKTASRKRG